MKKRKTVRKEDFKKFLQARPGEYFGKGCDDCPLHDWLKREVTGEDLDELPPWCSRFVGHWDAVHGKLSMPNGSAALQIMNELF